MMIKKQLLIALLLIVGTVNVFSQIAQETFNQQEGGTLDDSKAIVSNSLWHNWFGQLGVDMSLMNPYGSNFANVFPKGMSFGVDAAFGKWFTPEFGGRGRINVENAFFQIDKAEWWQRCSDGCIILNADFLSYRFVRLNSLKIS